MAQAHPDWLQVAIRMLTTLENLENSGNFKFTQGIFVSVNV